MSMPYLAFLWTAPFVLFLAHVCVCRVRRVDGELTGGQAVLLRLILTMNIPVLFAAAGLGTIERGTSELIPSLIYAFLFFNLMAFMYFQVYNLSETARRIRLMVFLRSHSGTASEGEIEEDYAPASMLYARLARLQATGQVQKDPSGRYHLVSRGILYCAFFIEGVRKILGFSGEKKKVNS